MAMHNGTRPRFLQHRYCEMRQYLKSFTIIYPQGGASGFRFRIILVQNVPTLSLLQSNMVRSNSGSPRCQKLSQYVVGTRARFSRRMVRSISGD
jgi:hypothetical protein